MSDTHIYLYSDSITFIYWSHWWEWNKLQWNQFNLVTSGEKPSNKVNAKIFALRGIKVRVLTLLALWFSCGPSWDGCLDSSNTYTFTCLQNRLIWFHLPHIQYTYIWSFFSKKNLLFGELFGSCKRLQYPAEFFSDQIGFMYIFIPKVSFQPN